MNTATRSMIFQSPACIDQLEADIQSNVNFWSQGGFWHVEAKCTGSKGVGMSLPAAVENFRINFGARA